MWERDRLTCPVHHGPVDQCPDDERDWYPQLSICWPSAVLEAAKAMYAQTWAERPFHDGSPERFSDPHRHWAEKRSAAFPFHAADGVSIGLSEVEDDDDYRWMGVVPNKSASETVEADERR